MIKYYILSSLLFFGNISGASGNLIPTPQQAKSLSVNEQIQQQTLMLKQHAIQDKNRLSERSNAKTKECQKHEDFINHLSSTATRQANDTVNFLRKTQQNTDEFAHSQAYSKSSAYEYFTQASNSAYVSAAAHVSYVQDLKFLCKKDRQQEMLTTSTEYFATAVRAMHQAVRQYKDTVSTQMFFLKNSLVEAADKKEERQ